MRLIINTGEMLKIQMGINLRGTKVGMTQQFLDGPQVATGLQQMTGKGMPQHVRMNPDRQPEFPPPGL